MALAIQMEGVRAYAREDPMGNRLSKIYTRTGDDGTTGLGDGNRVAKDDLRVEAYGTVDELNSAVGMILAVPGLPEPVVRCLTEVQHELFDLGGELCIPGYRLIQPQHVERLERALDGFNEALPALKDFILPGGGPAAAACHLARTVARRAERRVWTLIAAEKAAGTLVSADTPAPPSTSPSAGGKLSSGAQTQSSGPSVATLNLDSARYLNRLSDLLFVIARVLARHERGAEVVWRHDRGANGS
jgi:cob(I)alamin adenosyltransferase